MDHDWRVFDELKGYDIARRGNVIYIRDRSGRIYHLDLKEFNELRGTGPKPRGLE